MACKTPIVVPRNTSNIEIVGENEERGYLVDSGSDINLWTTLKNDNELQRPLTDINDLIKQWKHVYNNRAEAEQKAEVAYEWLKSLTWDRIAEQWDKLFTEAYNSLGKK